MAEVPKLLTIAGSDSGGGAGIQADLKTFAALGCHGMSAITALTAQNSTAVKAVLPIPPEFVAAQIEAVIADFGVDAVKIGMLHDADVVEAVAATLRERPVARLVVDPVMVAKDGSPLLDPDAVRALKELTSLASIVTPNIPEAELLTGIPIRSRRDMETAAARLLEFAPRVVVKGGRLADPERSSDFLATRDDPAGVWLDHARIETRNTHGAGCSFSSAIAALAARGLGWTDAVVKAREYLQGAIVAGAGRTLGPGRGPVDHFHIWKNHE